jgi:GDPmannose 4,6-dehydratase
VIATGITTTVREFVRKAFLEAGMELEFEGQGAEEVGRVVKAVKPDVKLPAGQVVVRVDPRYYRPTEVELLIGDPSKAKTQLGWQLHYDLDALIKDMVASDLNLFDRDKFLKAGGHKVFNYHE